MGAALFVVALCGCEPPADDHADETRDPNFQKGRELVNSQNFTGAMEEFTKALEANPHSAAAHFELAWLCEEKTHEYDEAIYHYKQHLKLRPRSEYAQRANEHVLVCRRQLAATEYAPSATVKELDRLKSENALLRQNIESIKVQLATAVAQQHAVPRVETPTSTTPPASNAIPARAPGQTLSATSQPPIQAARAGAPAAVPPAGALPPGAKTYVIKSGDTPAMIAKRNHVTLSAFLEANPTIKDPKRIHPGQTVILP